MIFADMANYAQTHHNIDLTVTSTISTAKKDRRLGRTSPAHRECRALDIRTKDINAFVIRDILRYINEKEEYEKYQYLSSSGKKRLAYFHYGTSEHIHLSLHSDYALKR